jgi:FdhD protein
MEVMDRPATRHVPVRRHRDGTAAAGGDWVAEEVPVALEYNGISHAVMLATPADLEDFALGFSLTEDIVDGVGDVRGLDVVGDARGLTVQVEVASSCFARLKERRRSLAGRTGCGLCGTESLQHAVRRPRPLASVARFDAASVRRGMDALGTRQPLHDTTGAVHAAALADADGHLLLVREDVGRHNALDKLIGAMARRRLAASDGFIVVTSRASYEMAGKAVRAGAPLLAAVSGVTALAVDVAHEAGLCLVGFARAGNLSIYAHPHRMNESARHGH